MLGAPRPRSVFYADPQTGKYGAATMNLVRLGGGITVLGVVGFIALSRRRDRQLATNQNKGPDPS